MPITGPNARQKRKELLKVLREKLNGRDITYRQIAEDFNVNFSYVTKLSAKLKCDMRIEKVVAEYEKRIAELEKFSDTQEEREKIVLDTLYHNCKENKDTNACIAWYKATGKWKEAEVQAREGDTEKIDWERILDKMERL